MPQFQQFFVSYKFLLSGNMGAKQILSIVLLLGTLCSVRGADWQGTGTFPHEMLSNIWINIENNIQKYVSVGTTDLPGFATFLSKAYNDLYDPAWNVFVIEMLDPTADAILYGYAFRDHWLWFNKYQFIGRQFSFVIWKDYNCQVWITVINSMGKDTYTNLDANYPFVSEAVSAFGAMLQSPDYLEIAYPYEDIWKVYYLLVKQMETRNPTKAYSAIAAQAGHDNTKTALTSINGRFCASAPNKYVYTFINNMPSSSPLGVGVHKFILFETRAY